MSRYTRKSKRGGGWRQGGAYYDSGKAAPLVQRMEVMPEGYAQAVKDSCTIIAHLEFGRLLHVWVKGSGEPIPDCCR